MNERKDQQIGKWFNPLLTSEERQTLEKELDGIDMEEIEALWDNSGELKTPSGRSTDSRWNRLKEEMESEPVVVPMYQSGFLKKAVGAFAFAAVLLTVLYLIQPTETIYDSQIISVKGERQEVSLPDGSIIQLNADSEVKWSSKDWEKDRIVVLDGEGFFEVVKSPKPFIVRTDFSETVVLGTSFNVYHREQITEVSCKTGKVKVQNEYGSVILKPGTTTSVNENADPLPAMEVDQNRIGSWQQGDFYFEDTKLNQVFQEIERQFDITIETDLDLQALRFTGYFSNENLQKSLETVCLTAGLEYRLSGSTAIISL